MQHRGDLRPRSARPRGRRQQLARCQYHVESWTPVQSAEEYVNDDDDQEIPTEGDIKEPSIDSSIEERRSDYLYPIATAAHRNSDGRIHPATSTSTSTSMSNTIDTDRIINMTGSTTVSAITPSEHNDDVDADRDIIPDATGNHPIPISSSPSSSSSSPSLSTPFDQDDDIQLVCSFINNYLLSEDTIITSSLPRLTPQQASMLRYRASQHDPEIISLLDRYQKALDIDHNNNNRHILQVEFIDDVRGIVDNLIVMEDECRLSQSNELDVLQAIFGDELSISLTCPLTVKVSVKLEDVDCCIELVFLIPPHYPHRDALIVNSYIPPPFDAFYSHETQENSLQTALVSTARSLIGDDGGAIYSCIECARSWISSQLHYLQISLERLATERAQKQAKSLLFDAFNEGHPGMNSQQDVGLFGRGRIEALMNEAISDMAKQRNISRAQAKALLRDSKWRISKQPIEAAIDTHIETNTIIDLSSFFIPLCAPSVILMCLSCLESFQWREGAMMRCGHFLCYSCYARYLLTHVNDGVILIHDAGQKCPLYVDESLIFSLLSNVSYAPYRRFMQNSFITLRGWRWCCSERCDYVASSNEQYGTILCFCGQSFCFTCGKSPGHWPLVCSETSSYYTSRVIKELRKKYQENKILQQDEEAIIVQTKPCPKCKQHWEKDGGCNHIRCNSCGYHYCYVCLQDWARHGVSWFECPWAEREVKSKKSAFYDTTMIDGDIEVMREFVSREADHSIRIKKLSAIKQNQNDIGSSLSLLLSIHSGTNEILLLDLISSLIQIHSVLQSIYIYLCLYQHELVRHRLTPLTTRLLYDLNMCEYFISALDSSFIPDVGNKIRQARSAYQLEETMRAIGKYTKIFATTLKLFIATEAQDITIRLEKKEGDDEEEQKLSTTTSMISIDRTDNPSIRYQMNNKNSGKNTNNNNNIPISNNGFIHRISAVAFFAALDGSSERGVGRTVNPDAGSDHNTIV